MATLDEMLGISGNRSQDNLIFPDFGGPRMDKEEMKAAVEQGIEKWLDRKFSELGKWTFWSFVAALLAALTYFIFWTKGYHIK